MGYLTKSILPQKHGERYMLRKLVTHYFLHEGILFRKAYDGDPLRCLGPKEGHKMLKEIYAGEYKEHQRRISCIGA